MIIEEITPLGTNKQGWVFYSSKDSKREPLSDSTSFASLVWPFFQKTVSFPGFFADMRGVVEGREGRENWAISKEKKSAIGRRHFLQLNRKGHMVKSITLDNLSTNILPAFLAFPCFFLLRTYVLLWLFLAFVQAVSYHYIPSAFYVVK